MHIDLDARLRCSDGIMVQLVDVVIDPSTRTVTHVVVHPERDHYVTRLVPIDRVDGSGERHLALDCEDADLDGFPRVSMIDYIRLDDTPVAAPEWAVGIRDVLALPHFAAEFDSGWYDDHYAVGWDRIPAGEVEIRRESTITSADGREIGTVDGFVCDRGGELTHIVLQHGHLFGRRDLAIPIGRVDRLANDEVVVTLTAAEIEALPAVRVHRRHHA
jgi:sporulation protein YlmC with PRC-barrel domain